MCLVLQQVNTEEELLEFEATQFPILQTMIAYKEPYDKLWRTALSFHNKNEAWLNGKIQYFAFENNAQGKGNLYCERQL